MFLFDACKETPQSSPSPKSLQSSETPQISDEYLESFGIDSQADNVLGGLKVGDLAPEFVLNNEKGVEHKLSTALDGAPVILTFYRGHWCQYCTKYFSALQDSLKSLSNSSMYIHYAISPEKTESTKKMIIDNMFNLNFLHDLNYKVMKDYKVFFNVNSNCQQKVQNQTNTTIADLNGHTSPSLPVTASYVIGQDHRIKYVHYDIDYTKRADIDNLLAYFR